MPRTCTICRHSQRERIEQALLAGRGLRDVAARFGTSKTSLARHKEKHLKAELVAAHRAAEAERPGRLLDDVRGSENRAERLYEAAEQILGRALKARDLRTALQAIRAAVDVIGEARQHLELRGELTGEIAAPIPAQQNIVVLMPQVPAAAPAQPSPAAGVVLDITTTE